MYIKVKNDLFDISERVKELNSDYEIFYDTDKCKYVVMNKTGICATLPYKTLDARTLDYLYETRAENIEKLMEDIDKHNKNVEKDGIKRTQDEIENEFSRRLRLLKL